MTQQVDNLRRGRWTHGGWLVVPCVALIVGSAGVVAGPGSELALAEARVSAARLFADTGQREWRERLEYRQAGGDRILSEIDALIARELPAAPSELEIHTVVKVIAAARDVELKSIGAGSEPEQVDAANVPNLMRRRIELRGGATLDAWKGVVADLRSLGFPAAVVGFSFARGQTGDTRFEGHVELDLFHARATNTEHPAARSHG